MPKATFITEEDTVENEDSELAWIVDPLDGTTNFLYGIPIYSISLALKAGHEVVVGIVHAIHQNETFYAWHQGGAYLNKKSIQVNQRKELMEALIGTGFPYDKQKRLEKPLKIMQFTAGSMQGYTQIGFGGHGSCLCGFRSTRLLLRIQSECLGCGSRWKDRAGSWWCGD